MENKDQQALSKLEPFASPIMTQAGDMMQGQALQQVKTAYTTAVAVQTPRSLTRILANVLEEAKLAGKAFYYGWKVKDKKTGRKIPIEGPSIDLAMCMARNYGNCVLDIEATETNTHFLIKGIFIDLETGFTAPRLFRLTKKTSMGAGYDKDRAEDIVFQIAQSKAIRNAILKAMPDWMVTKAIQEAKEAETAQIEDINEARVKAVGYFKDSYGIDQTRLESAVGKVADLWTKMDLVDLKGTITAINEGRVTADEAFPKIIEETPDIIQELKDKKQEVKDQLLDGTYKEPEGKEPEKIKDEVLEEGKEDEKEDYGSNKEEFDEGKRLQHGKITPGIEQEIWEKNYVRLKSGYEAKVENDLEFFSEGSEDLQKKGKDKWNRLRKSGSIDLDKPWPLDKAEDTPGGVDEDTGVEDEAAGELAAKIKHIEIFEQERITFACEMLGLQGKDDHDIDISAIDLLTAKRLVDYLERF